MIIVIVIIVIIIIVIMIMVLIISEANPCSEDPEYSFRACVSSWVANKAGCHLDWFRSYQPHHRHHYADDHHHIYYHHHVYDGHHRDFDHIVQSTTEQ